MEFKLVYRALRKISDWTLGGFYSEVHIEGQENVARTGPLIMYVYARFFSGTLLCVVSGLGIRVGGAVWRETSVKRSIQPEHITTTFDPSPTVFAFNGPGTF
jgi:hypothetical protein